MALFDSIISGVSEKFDLGDKGGTLLSALLALMTNQETGGFSGFLGRFKDAGMGDMASSWIASGDNAEVSDEQIETAIGSETIDTIAEQVGMDRDKTTSALAFMTPKVVDNLTPDGEVPDDESIVSKIGGFLTGLGGAAVGAVGAVASGAADKAGDAVDAAKDAAGAAADKAGDAVDAAKDVAGAAADKVGDAADAAGAAVGKGKEVVGDAADAVGNVAGAAADKVGDAFGSVSDTFNGDGDGGSILKWLLPILLLGVLLFLAYSFFSGNQPTKPAEGNTNTAESKDGKDAEEKASSVSLEAKDGKYFLTGTVKDEETKNQIVKEAEGTFGEGNVDASGLNVDASVAALKDGWFDGFKGLLPDLKDWKNGTISWAGDKLSTAGEVPGAVADKLKSLFGGWTMAEAANETKDSVDGENRELTEVTLSDGTKLQAYPGGIEDQLVKFVQSDEYKNATNEELKNKWFDFDDLNFKFGATELAPESKRQLDNIVAILKANPEVKIKIGGYTDKKGNDEANKKLSQNRADAVKAALEKAGVGSQVPEAEGYGEEFAKVDENASDEERKADRKTSIRLIKSDGEKTAETSEKKE